ncbi:alkaline phosphatase family protein [Natrinema limicola]|uniref:Sulfatase N-terminal domain-containing protein n=1 Tax=Natrinema limicola JCM 13563 TaxID=1230457 RepID=M0CDX9_9EURY|nr:hypothetical protein [Natrinema limicola]ELZ21460.1 hypothetical protein C476_08238 [Natrinema limicola JCM 13563]
MLVRPFTKPGDNSIEFLDEDWDVLVVLDACRYDLFARKNPFDVSVDKVHSNATQTREYIRNNFVGRDYRDTVYVTASPQFADFELNFAHIEHVWRDRWDEEYNTVRPESITEAAIDVANRYDDKRLIIHYMQPHYPFIGPTGRKLDEQATFVPNPENLSVWEQLSAGHLDEETVRKAYEENLSVVVPEVERLVENVEGKTVITSDHGNLFGQRVCWLPIRIYGHPARVHHPELTAVPWVELPYDSRREVIPATETMDTDTSFEAVEERLADLGYK